MTKEKLPERFEKNFFSDTNKNNGVGMTFEVGEIYDTEPFEITPERIRLYAEGTEDYNPFYF